MSNYSFATMPSVSISRSRFQRNSQHKTTFNLGQIIPIYVDEVLPGDTRSIDVASLIRMSTPIAPIMDNIVLDLHAFFVPNRLVWDHWKDFLGENNSSAGIRQVEYHTPQLLDTMAGEDIGHESLLAYMGIPIGFGSKSLKDLLTYTKIQCLPLRAYYAIYNTWYRNENVIAPVPIQTSDSDGALLQSGYNTSFIKYVSGTTNQTKSDAVLAPMLASKLPDYFVKSLPYAQKGAAVVIPSTPTAPVGLMNVTNSKTSSIEDTTILTDVASLPGGKVTKAYYDGVDSSSDSVELALKVDLSGVLGTINDLRFAFQLQKLLEKDAMYGTKYWSILAAHFGVEAPDATIQVPEYLGGKRIHINIDQVLSTAGYANTDATNVGQPGANSVTGNKSSLFTKSFVEHGFIMIMAVARQDHTYCQGINRMWNRYGRYDHYWPVFANLGAQAVRISEIYAAGTDDDEEIFGYQEAWAEYRFKPSIATGLLAPTVEGSLDYWTLTDEFAQKPTLGRLFIEEGRDNLERALVTGSSGPDFVADFFFNDIAVRPLPTYSIPGLVDHH